MGSGIVRDDDVQMDPPEALGRARQSSGRGIWSAAYLDPRKWAPAISEIILQGGGVHFLGKPLHSTTYAHHHTDATAKPKRVGDWRREMQAQDAELLIHVDGKCKTCHWTKCPEGCNRRWHTLEQLKQHSCGRRLTDYPMVGKQQGES